MAHVNARASANALQRMWTMLRVGILLMQLRGPIIRRGLPRTRLQVGGVDGPNDGSKESMTRIAAAYWLGLVISS